MAGWLLRRTWRLGGRRLILPVLLGTLAVLVLVTGTAHAQVAIQITKLRDLNFGGCDNVAGSTYTVAAAASPGGAACFGAASAQFLVSGEPSTRARVRLPNNVTATNGSESLTVALTDSLGGNQICFGAGGSVTVYLGGSLTLPAGGLTTFGLFIGTDQFELSYIGGSC